MKKKNQNMEFLFKYMEKKIVVKKQELQNSEA